MKRFWLYNYVFCDYFNVILIDVRIHGGVIDSLELTSQSLRRRRCSLESYSCICFSFAVV